MAKTAKIASKQKRISDIASMLEQGKERKEILQKLSKTCKVSARTLDNEIQEAKTIVAERNKHKEAIRLEQTTQTLKESLNEAIVSDLELEAVLCTIATGKMKVEEIIRGNTILREITPMEQINAINTLYRKRGSNAPSKVAQTDSQGNDLSNIPDDQLKAKIATALKVLNE